MSWFDVAPCWMIFTHYPQNPLDQMLGDYTLSKEDYKLLPFLHPSYEEYGFESTDLLSYFIHTKSCEFPKIYPNYSIYLEFVDIPITSRLHPTEQYGISVIKKRDCHLAIINDKDFMLDDEQNSQWKQNGSKWTVAFLPKKRGTLSLSIRDPEKETLYHTILEYKL